MTIFSSKLPVSRLTPTAANINQPGESPQSSPRPAHLEKQKEAKFSELVPRYIALNQPHIDSSAPHPFHTRSTAERSNILSQNLRLKRQVAAPAQPTGEANSVIMAAISTMPSGGSYSVGPEARRALEDSIRISLRERRLIVTPTNEKPTFDTAATYLVFLKSILEYVNQAAKTGPSSYFSLRKFLVSGQRAGMHIWGRWKALGPGVACLIKEADLGINFTDPYAAKPGDFMKIFRSETVGKKETSQLAIYIGKDVRNGVAYIKYWSGNSPEGFSFKEEPMHGMRAIFSRITKLENIGNLQLLPKINDYLSRINMEEGRRHPKQGTTLSPINREDLTMEEALRQCGTVTRPPV